MSTRIFKKKYFLNYCLFFSIVFSLQVSASEGYLLYEPERKNIDPIQHYFNASYDVIQNGYYFSQDRYFEKHEILFRRVFSPFHSLKKDGGTKKLLRDEFFGKRVVPNITLHFLGGGYDKRLLTEYFEEQGSAYPRFFAYTLAYLGHFGNEALELTSSRITSHDHLADLYFFDLASIALANWDQGLKFLRNDLGMMHWHMQPMWELGREDFTNAGLNYVFRPKLLNEKFMLYLGMKNMVGYSHKLAEGRFLSLAGGASFTDPIEGKAKFSYGLFYDEERQLGSSLVFNDSEDYRARLNLFPSFLKIKEHRFGLLLGQRKNRNIVAGLSYRLPLGIAF